jgi:hypothetical protein
MPVTAAMTSLMSLPIIGVLLAIVRNDPVLVA